MKRWWTCFVWVMALSFFLPQALQADEISDLKRQLEKTEKRLTALEQKGAAGAEAEEDWRPFEEMVKGVEFHGAIDLTYIDWEPEGQSGGTSTLDVYELYLAAYTQLGKDLSVYFEPRYEHAGDTIELRQGFVDWKILEPLTARFGKFYMPIGIFRDAYYASLRNLVSYPFSMRMINVAPWSDVGVKLYGEQGFINDDMKIKFELAVVNGLNEEYTENSSDKVRKARQNRDNNSNKTIGGRIGLVPFRGLEIGGSYNTGKYDDDAEYTLEFVGADLAFTYADLALRAEWVKSTAETVAGDIETWGGYANLGYKFLKDQWGLNFVEGVVAYDYIDPGQDIKDRFFIYAEQKVEKISLGLRAELMDHFFIKAEYQFTEEEDPEIDNDAVFAQVVAAF
ncbi:MAG: hypothetical protein SWE60_02525 [Thermodesulfobacteriota bacterium]|nr:hypothetical protein [Thermodesulfobacteriota bacterium]